MLTEDDCTTFVEVLKKWKEETSVTLHNTLRKIKESTFQKDILAKFQPHFKNFLKSVGGEESVDQETIDLMQQCRVALKKAEETLSKAPAVLEPIPLMKKSSSNISDVGVPKTLGNALSPTRKTVLQNLYRRFVNGLPEEYKQHPSLVDYLSKVEAHLYANSKGDPKVEQRLASSVLESLSPEKTVTARIRMLKGEITPADVAQDKSKAFMSDEEIRQYEQLSQKELQYANVDFYTSHLKKMTGTESCRYCKKELAAYCEYQKQTRRSDEPMTRFMRCKLCDRSWRD